MEKVDDVSVFHVQTVRAGSLELRELFGDDAHELVSADDRPILRLRRGGRAIELRAPVSGTVVGSNEALHDRPRLVNDEPFARGWAVRIRADEKDYVDPLVRYFHFRETRR